MTQHQGLPVAGYKPQSDEKVAHVNINKELEERCLRQIEFLQGRLIDADATHYIAAYDHRMLALARTSIQEAFMWMNRAVFQPDRISLPEDEA